MTLAAEVDIVRDFNRFYTRQIGLLREGLLRTRFSLTEARVLYELGSRPGIRSTELIRELDLDPGYLSRLLKQFGKQGLLIRSTSKDDRRVTLLVLSPRGRREFLRLNARSHSEIAGMLTGMPLPERRKLVDSMTAIRRIVDTAARGEPAFVIRTHRPGDIGWVIARHGALYAEEYGWDGSFEGLVARIAGDFLRNFDERSERCWIAERNGEPIGSVFLVKQSKTAGKLRMLLVEPSARGMGVGSRLVEECIAFARQCGYRKLTLWTNDILHAARRIYQRAGFQLVREERHHSFGHDLVGQYWALRL
ncbi:MAG TPA: helix-turn-helix domain-containing GNAT family N-acetyltransferase [Verrucomicrobiae bacterium]|nr:helix-turn-helix domain-containing GNAT family N-acetyltransferase [Verrucomicrobiae bacterium]